LRAFREQRNLTEAIADRFATAGFNLKSVFKDWILSDFYRADALAAAVAEPCRQAELDDIGLMRLLSPEQLERKVAAVFGEKWNKLDGEMAMLYGGIDSKEVTDRATDPSGAMGAIQRILSNDMACRHVGRDFGKPANERWLFPNIEPDVLPGASEEGDKAIRRAIAFLHEKVLGRYDAIHSAEVNRTFELFASVVSDAKGRKGVEREEAWSCRQSNPPPPIDQNYTIRAWRAVVTYLLRRQEFLFE
jgi:hypothetical protein